MTSPSSVRWTGHLAAITRRRSTCSSVQPSGSRKSSLNLVGHPRSAGVYSHSTSTGPMSQPLRLAYISIVIAVHDARLAASSSCGLGPSSSPAEVRRLVGRQLMVADVDLVGKAMLRAMCGCPHWRSSDVDVPIRSDRSAVSARYSRERIEHQTRGDLREEVRRLRRHALAGGGDRLDAASIGVGAMKNAAS